MSSVKSGQNGQPLIDPTVLLNQDEIQLVITALFAAPRMMLTVDFGHIQQQLGYKQVRWTCFFLPIFFSYSIGWLPSS